MSSSSRPAGDAGKQVVQATRGAQGDQIVLIEEGRPRTDQAEIAAKNADQLWQLVEAGLAQEGADRRQIAFRMG
jgi:hypothetical protein